MAASSSVLRRARRGCTTGQGSVACPASPGRCGLLRGSVLDRRSGLGSMRHGKRDEDGWRYVNYINRLLCGISVLWVPGMFNFVRHLTCATVELERHACSVGKNCTHGESTACSKQD